MRDSTGPLIRVEEGDIAGFGGDAVVNAANNHLVMSEGVAGALAERGGPTIQAACEAFVREHGPLDVGEAMVSPAGDLPARMVVHAAAMGDEAASAHSVRSATRSALRLAAARGARRVAFPVLGSGTGGFPFDEAARLMIDEIRAFDDDALETVVLFGYTREQADALRRLLL